MGTPIAQASPDGETKWSQAGHAPSGFRACATASPIHLASRFVDHAQKRARGHIWGHLPTLGLHGDLSRGGSRTGRSRGCRKATSDGLARGLASHEFPFASRARVVVEPRQRHSSVVRREPIKVDIPASGLGVTRWTEVRSNTSLASTPPTESQADSERRAGATTSLSSLDSLPPLLTIEEVAAVLRTSRKGVYAMAERRQLPGITRIGRRLLPESWTDAPTIPR